ncbi:hypothetical protein [Pseudoalteromonas denitrificans]|uniref:Uncharacterized protein n=1 Tax=Pseudoalteromonas denitrificans DSM 6059 TaxID=1123010 RepID=A0A1I1PES6_9GAMM|nr:hypothetical protein SAMN02745724_03416 [Pseudoalteromonas denitrificans DSM 6059]
MSNKDFDSFLKHSLENMPEEIQPKKDLWQGIDRAIDFKVKPKTLNHFTKLSVVAACFAAALLSFNFLSTIQMQSNDSEINNVITMSEIFETQKNALLVQYQEKPALTDDWQAQLDDLEQAEQAIKQALKNEPQNSALLRMLAQVYRQELELINRVHQPKWQQI